MAALVIAVMLVVMDFHDVNTCVVQGYVYRMQETEDVSFSRADSCAAIRHRTAGPDIELWSPRYWVIVIIPAEKGHRRFQSRWGAHVAHLDATTVPIAWGRVLTE